MCKSVNRISKTNSSNINQFILKFSKEIITIFDGPKISYKIYLDADHNFYYEVIKPQILKVSTVKFDTPIKMYLDRDHNFFSDFSKHFLLMARSYINALISYLERDHNFFSILFVHKIITTFLV